MQRRCGWRWRWETDAAPDNSCLYVLPRPYDPGYTAGDDDDSEVDPLPRALHCKQSYQNIRAVPAEAGSAVLFTHRIIHWGSKGRQVRSRLSPPRTHAPFFGS